MLNWIQKIDEWLLLTLQEGHNYWLNGIFWYVSKAWIFLPLWLWAIFQVFKNYSTRNFWKIVLMIILTIGLSDQMSNLFKYQFKRLRPTHDVRYSEKIHLVNNYKGGTYGFYSAHASNSAAVCVLSVMLIRRNKYKYLLIVYPLLTGISRMYLGVHFLSDVLVGWIMGGMIAFGVYLIFEKYLGLISK